MGRSVKRRRNALESRETFGVGAGVALVLGDQSHAVVMGVDDGEVARLPITTIRSPRAVTPTSSMRRRFKAAASCNREQFFRADYLCCRVSAGTTELFEGDRFVDREEAEGILLMTGHNILQGGETVSPKLSLPPSRRTGNSQHK